jgi:uncharacterized phiE125 gp8 family phage protein
MLKPVRTVAPSGPIVTLNDAKAHLRVDHAAEDGLISDLIAAADAHFDGWSGILGRCVRPQTWRLSLAGLKDTRLPFPDVQSAVIRYLDLAETEQVLPGQNYQLQNDDGGAFVELVSGIVQPAVADRINAVRIEAVYGMAEVPYPIKAAALMHVAWLYRQREGTGAAPEAIDALIAPYRMRSL